MGTDPSRTPLHSVLAPFLEEFVQEKQACGYRYREETRVLGHLDHFLFTEGLRSLELPRSIAQRWVSQKAHESSGTHPHRLTLLRQFSTFLLRRGYPAYVPESLRAPRDRSSFVPRILTQEEMGRLLQAVDRLAPTARSPLRPLIMPEIFRLLYGCGFRLGEVLHLRVRDVDLDHGILTVRQGKGGKDRLIPPASSLVQRLRRYAEGLGPRPPEAFFFPSPQGGALDGRTVYDLFRQLLLQCRIPHGGRGQGPRLHDLRHGFAVHTLLRWYHEGADLEAKLPLLATYLGHEHLAGTQRYLHLTAELFPQIVARVDAAFGEVIPGRVVP